VFAQDQGGGGSDESVGCGWPNEGEEENYVILTYKYIGELEIPLLCQLRCAQGKSGGEMAVII
jgi:hypothetical protein